MLVKKFENEDDNLDGLGGGGGGAGDVGGDGAGGADGGQDGGQAGGDGGDGGVPGAEGRPTRQQNRDKFNENLELRRQLDESRQSNEALRSTLAELNQTLKSNRGPAAGDPRKVAYDAFVKASKNLNEKDPDSLERWTKAHEELLRVGLKSELAEELRRELGAALPPQRSGDIQRIHDEFPFLRDEQMEHEAYVETCRAARRRGIEVTSEGKIRCSKDVLFKLMREGAIVTAKANGINIGGRSGDNGTRDRMSSPGGRNGDGRGSGGQPAQSSEERTRILQATANIPGQMYRDKAGNLKPEEERLRIWNAVRSKETRAS